MSENLDATERLAKKYNMLIFVWMLLPLLVAFIVFPTIKEEREKKWIFAIWFPVMAFACAGTLCALNALLSMGSSSSGPGAPLEGIATISAVAFCLPCPILLYFCLKYRPGPQAYTLPYVMPTVLAVVLLAVVLGFLFAAAFLIKTLGIILSAAAKLFVSACRSLDDMH